MQRRRISSRGVGPPVINWISIVWIVLMGWLMWAYLWIETGYAGWAFAIFLAVSLLTCYLGFHTRRVEIDDSYLYVDGLLSNRFVGIPFHQIKTIKLHRPFPGQVMISFEEKTPVGSWILLHPRKQALTTLSGNSDVVELQDRVKKARRTEGKASQP